MSKDEINKMFDDAKMELVSNEGNNYKAILRDRIENDFTYHKPKNNQPHRYQSIRSMGKNLAKLIIDYCPEGRELSIALAKIEESVMWANAGITREKAND